MQLQYLIIIFAEFGTFLFFSHTDYIVKLNKSKKEQKQFISNHNGTIINLFLILSQTKIT